MMNRISNRLIARFVAVAALLALVMAAPAVFAQDSEIDYPENGTEPVASFSATDPDGDAIVFSLSGPDAAKFEISEGGALSFKSTPDFESAGDADGDNVYMVTVNAAGGSTSVAVTVTNEDEAGKVTIDDLQPQAGAGQSISAKVSDTDGDPVATTWQWSRSMDMTSWEDIVGATSSAYTPQEEDDGYYLRAAASYSDGLGDERDTASTETAFPVEIRPPANFAPSFGVQDEDAAVRGVQVSRTVKETAKAGSGIGAPVVATDADNDPLLYKLGKVTVITDLGNDNAVGGTGDNADDTTDVVIIDLGDDNAVGGTGDDADTTVDVTTLFGIDAKTGQISVRGDAGKEELAYLNIDVYPNTTVVMDDISDGGNDPTTETTPLAYDVLVTATDPSGADKSVTVTIKVVKVDEAPGIKRLETDLGEDLGIASAGADRFRISTEEQIQLDPAADPSATNAGAGLPVFYATDPENAAADESDLTWTVSGVDAKRFNIVPLVIVAGATYEDPDGDGTDISPAISDPDGDGPLTATSPLPQAQASLRWKGPAPFGPSFEDMDSADGDNVYEVTVTVSDGVARSSKDVFVTVTNKEEPGKITLTQRRPQEGIAITARLSDPDGNITDTKWQWYRGDDLIGTFIEADPNDDGKQRVSTLRIDSDTTGQGGGVDGEIDTDDTTVVTNCTLETGTPSSTCAINNATSSTYTPVADDDGKKLQVRASYVDGFATDKLLAEGLNTAGDPTDDKTDGKDDGDVASAVSEQTAVERPNANARPRFVDEDPAARSVSENVKNAGVGEPVAATDPGDPLIYTLSGDDAGSFKVDDSGQIQTKVKLDYETKSSYTITVTATDPSLASASITVDITVTDADDPATVTLLADNGSVEYAENGTDPVGTFDATDADGDPIVFSLSGPDAAKFEISEGGVLSFKSSPDFESAGDADGDNVYMVMVNAAGGSTSVAVTVTNEDEAGKVTIDDLQPQAGAGQSISAKVSDTDGDPVATTWQWSRSMDMSEWEDIVGATSSAYTPQEEDDGYYLRASASYSDGLGDERDTASAETAFPVEIRPPANFAPSFGVQDEDAAKRGVQVSRTVKETAKAGSGIGAPVVATDADNDPLLYKLGKVTYVTGLGDDSALGGTGDNADDTTDVVIIDLGDDDAVGGTGDDADTTVDVTTLFRIDPKTGQISVRGDAGKEELAYLNIDVHSSILPFSESETTPGLYAPAATTPPTPLAYDVLVTATDPSGADKSVTVTIKVAKVDEAPGIKRLDVDLTADTPIASAGADRFRISTEEQIQLDPAADPSAANAGEGLPVFYAEDPENPLIDVNGNNAIDEGDSPGADEDDLTWTVSGVDAGRFNIVPLVIAAGATYNHDGDDTTAAILAPQAQASLRWKGPAPYGPSFEDMDSADGDNVYEVTVTVSDGVARSSKDVFVTVTNKEEPGEITLTQRRPQEGIAITARLSDPDGNITDTKWQWYRGDVAIGTFIETDSTTSKQTVSTLRVNDNGTPTDATDDGGANSEINDTDSVVTNCTLETGTPSITCAINNATSSTYTPVADDDGKKLQVRASYVDGFATDKLLNADPDDDDTFDAKDGKDDGDVASAVSEQTAVERPNANARPRFVDEDPVARSVSENVKNAGVGEPVAATDPGDPLIYTLSGDDAGSFKVDNSGQIQTKVKLDYETKSSYTITVTATDPSLASASITVNITVTDADDDATVILLTGNAPAFAAEEMTRSVAENTAAGMAIGDPVAATDEDGDALTYTLWGDDAGSFGIDPATGQLMTSAALDYETQMSYTVTVTASSGKADEVDAMTTVTIMVTDEGLDNAYDLNEDGTIERDEVIAAIQDYLAGNIERSEVTALIRLYFGNGG